MPKSQEQRIQELEDQVCALQQLLLAHIAAFADVDTLATAGALRIARVQARAAVDAGSGRAGHIILGLVKAIEGIRV